MSTDTLTFLSRGWSMFLLLETRWDFEIVLTNRVGQKDAV